MNKKIIDCVDNEDISVGDRVIIKCSNDKWDGAPGEVYRKWGSSGWYIELDEEYKYLIENHNIHDEARIYSNNLKRL